jgi:hypothetical protein
VLTFTLDSKTRINFIQWLIEEVDALKGEQLLTTNVKLDE